MAPDAQSRDPAAPEAHVPLDYAPQPDTPHLTLRNWLAIVWIVLGSSATACILFAIGRAKQNPFLSLLGPIAGLPPVLAELALLVLRRQRAVYIIYLFGFLWLLCLIGASVLAVVILWILASPLVTTDPSEPLPLTAAVVLVALPAVLALLTYMALREHRHILKHIADPSSPPA